MDNLQDRPRVFVGRRPELSALTRALAAAQAGEPQVVVVQGEAGIGKSSLISEFLDGRPSTPVIRVSGETAESVLPYGVVQQLAAAAAAVSATSSAGLKLLLRGPAADADPLAVGVELLALVSAFQNEDAAAVVVEDLQWLDLPSARALLFACRRLRADRVLVILTCRPESIGRLGEGWARFVSADQRASGIELAGLDVSDLAVLCRRLGRGRLSERAIRRLAGHTGGNPLLARAMLAELGDDVLEAAGGTLPAPKLLAGLIRARLAAVPKAARDLVMAAAVLGDHCSLAEAAAVAGLAEPTAALEKAQRAGFLAEQPARVGHVVSFPHPLVRQAVYDDLGPQRRQQLHRRAAAVLTGVGALDHRVAAAVGPDLELAADLRRAADAAAGSGKMLLAARYLEHAASVMGHGPDRNDLTLTCFEWRVWAADVAAADAARPIIERLPASARRDAALGQLALLAARPSEAIALLRAAWEASVAAGETNSGGEAALSLGQVLGVTGAVTEAEMWLDRSLSSGTGREPWYDAARCIRSYAYALSGDTSRSLALFRDLPDPPATVPAAQTDALTYRGIARLCAGDTQAASGDLSLTVRRVSEGLQVRFPGPPHGFLAEAEFRLGHWDDAQGHAELAVALARDTDRDFDLAFAHSFAVSVVACRGDWPAASAHADAAERAARLFGGLASAFTASARGLLGFARGDPDESLRGAAIALAAPSVDRFDNVAASWWRPAQIWALIQRGQHAEADGLLASFESRAAGRSDPGARILAAWLRGTLAMSRDDLDQADQVLHAGRLAAGHLPWPFHCALIDLQHGQCLARMHRRAAAIEAVRAADAAFSALLARPFMQAAQAELAALGLRPRADEHPDLPGLTQQELRVAKLVTTGLSNREIAARLYLSPKTIDYHLANAFAKLGIHSRHQLIAMIRRHEPAQTRD